MTVVQLKDNLGTGNTNRDPSPGIWGGFPVGPIKDGTIAGQYFFDDFDMWPLQSDLTTQIKHGQYKAHLDTSCTMTSISTVNSVELGKGILQIGSNAAEDVNALAQSYPSYLLSSTAGKLCFEARIATDDVTTANGLGFFIGLAETETFTFSDVIPLTAADAPVNTGSYIGFHFPEDDLTTIDTVYTDRAATWTQVKDAAVTGLAANTFMKLGFVFDPKLPAAKRITFYKNGVPLDDKIACSTLTGLTNLDANALGLMLATVVDTGGAAINFWMDWWAVGQIG
jgi:hypothetical protein